jgi:hypothetical protein
MGSEPVLVKMVRTEGLSSAASGSAFADPLQYDKRGTRLAVCYPSRLINRPRTHKLVCLVTRSRQSLSFRQLNNPLGDV